MSKVITYSTYIEGLPNIFHLGDLQDNRSTGNNANGSTILSLQLPLPLALTPQHLAVQLLASGFFPQAAQIYWTAVMRRPSAMFSAEAATSLMLNHISSAAMPFYFTSTAATPTVGRNMDSNDRPGPPKEVTDLSWGWGTWEGRCCRAVR